MGRKAIKDKKVQVAICIEPSKIAVFGGEEMLKEYLIFSATEMAKKLNELKTSELDKIVIK